MLLRKLKNKHKARKEDSDLAMHFLEVYTHHFEARRKEIKSVLEIGVQYGGSLKMWRDYFPNAQITGMDINKKCKKHRGDRIDVVVGDQGNTLLLDSFGNFDIIIDDGGHTMSQQKDSIRILWEHLNSGGVYVLEDLETSYWPKFDGGYSPYGGKGIRTISTIDMLKSLVDNLNHKAIAHDRAEHFKAEVIDNHIKSMHFYPSLCLLYKE